MQPAAGPSSAVPGSIQGAQVPVAAGTTANQQMIHPRLNDSFDAIRHEFEICLQEIAVLRGQRDDFENKGVHIFRSVVLLSFPLLVASTSRGNLALVLAAVKIFK